MKWLLAKLLNILRKKVINYIIIRLSFLRANQINLESKLSPFYLASHSALIVKCNKNLVLNIEQ